MTADAGMAFAQLFSQRRRELDLSVVDVAVSTGLPIEVVVGWDQGRSVPGGDDLDKVSDFLKLPKPLLKEALRRVADHRLETTGPDLPRPPEPAEDPFDAASMSQEALLDDPYPSTTVSERLRQLPGMARRSFSGLFNDIRRYWSRKRRMARAPTAYPSYREDRDQLLTYRLRMVFTAAGTAVLALVLRWSLGGLGTSIADLWNALTGAL